MKKTFSILALASALFFVSCKKEKMDQPGNNDPVEKKLVSTTVNGKIDLSYNADGTIKQIKFFRAWGIVTRDFTYSTGKVNFVGRLNGKVEQSGEYTMVNGKATSLSITNHDAFEVPYSTDGQTYEYNAKGLLSKLTFQSGHYYLMTYDNNDNMVLSVYYSPQNQAEAKTEYTYAPQKDLFPSFGDVNSWGDRFFLPAAGKNLRQTSKNTNLLTSMVEYESVYSYQFDTDGYVISASCHYLTSGFNDYSWTNTFQ